MAKLKGNTLIEVLMAMVILLFCTSLGTSIYISVLQSQNTGERINTFLKLQDLSAKIEKEKDFLDKEWEESEFSFTKTCKPYKGNNSIIVLKLEAKNAGKKIVSEYKKIIFVE